MALTRDEIIARSKELAKRFEDLNLKDRDEAAATALAEVHRSALRRAEAEEQVAASVMHAREHGISWDAIGRRLGTTGEAARQRYGQLATA